MDAEGEKPGAGNAATPEQKPEASPAAAPEKPEGTLLSTPPKPAPEGKQKPTESKESEQPTKPRAPEKYADFQLPNGVNLESATVEDLTKVAKALDLPQAGAQTVLNMALGWRDKMLATQKAALNDMGENWRSEAKLDQEIGGGNLDRTVEAATGYLKRELGKERAEKLLSVLDATKLGNHPDLIRVLAHAEHVTAQDRAVLGGGVPKDTFLGDIYNRTPNAV
jgi:hypothetical protein